MFKRPDVTDVSQQYISLFFFSSPSFCFSPSGGHQWFLFLLFHVFSFRVSSGSTNFVWVCAWAFLAADGDIYIPSKFFVFGPSRAIKNKERRGGISDGSCESDVILPEGTNIVTVFEYISSRNSCLTNLHFIVLILAGFAWAVRRICTDLYMHSFLCYLA